METPLLAALCVAGVLLPWGGPRTWIAAANWAGRYGFGGLAGGSRAVTTVAAAVALLGAGMRVAAACGWRAKLLKRIGLYLVVAPVCLLMPVIGSSCFLAAAALVVGVGWRTATEERAQSWSEVLLGESFPILSAGCFAVLGWQYNAQLLTRGLLVSAGIALVARAALPGKAAASLREG